MNKRIKAKWLKALRSGRYKQGHNRLYEDREYCCLGVLCKAMDTPIRKYAGFLSGDILAKAGITGQQESRLVGLNDGHHSHSGGYIEPKTFDQIADWIEAHL